MTKQSTPADAGARAPAAPWGVSWPLLVAMAAFIIGLHPNLLKDGDTYWHLAAANWMFQHLAVPDTDPFSHTMRGAPWLAHEWLAEAILGAAHWLGGWTGTVVVSAAAFAAALALLCRYLLRHLEPIYALALVAMALCLAANHLLARPHTLAFPLLVAWVVQLLLAREENRAPARASVLLMVLWANLHGSFVLGLALAGFFAAEAVVAEPSGRRRAVAQDWGMFFLLSLGAALVTPYGFSGLAFTFSVHGMDHAMGTIGEWRSPNFHRFQPLELAIMLGGLAVLGRGLKLPWMRALLVLGLLHLALKHIRHGEIFGFLVPLVVAESVGRQWQGGADGEQARDLDRWFRALAAPAKPLALAVALAALALVTYGAGQTDRLRPASNITPEAAVRAGLAAVPEGKVLNAYEFGGYLVYSGIPPFIDGRNDVYGDRFLGEFIKALSASEPSGLSRLLDQHGVGWTVLQPSLPAAILLDRLPGWRRLYSDDVAVVHMRSSGRP